MGQPLGGPARLDGIEGDGGGVQSGQVVGAVDAVAEGVMEQGLGGDCRLPQRRQGKVDAQPLPCDNKDRSGEGGGVDRLALVVEPCPVNLRIVFPYPQANVTELPQADAAADEVLVGVEDQVQQILVGRHGQHVHLHRLGVEVREKAIKLIVGILRGVKQPPVQLDVQGTARLGVGTLI